MLNWPLGNLKLCTNHKNIDYKLIKNQFNSKSAHPSNWQFVNLIFEWKMFAHTLRMERNQTETTNGMYGEHYHRKGTKKIHVQPVLQPILHHIDEKRGEYLENLKHLTTIPNCDWKAVQFCENWFKRHNIRYECFHVPPFGEKGESVNVPPIIVASWITSRHKKTVNPLENSIYKTGT